MSLLRPSRLVHLKGNEEFSFGATVKATGYLQSWTQPKPSTPKYTFPAAYATSMWGEALGREVTVDTASRVDAWVFALQTCTLHALYRPLDLEQWEFRVVSHRKLIATGQNQAGSLSSTAWVQPRSRSMA